MLDRQRSYKPLDFGNGLVSGSINERGQLVALNTYHPGVGYITLSTQPPFPDELRYDQTAVRRYRRSLASHDQPGYGFDFGPIAGPARCTIDSPAIPQVSFTLENGLEVELITCAPTQNKEAFPGALQRCTITNPLSQVVTLTFNWRGTLTMTRSSYTQLTEGGPIPAPKDNYRVAVRDGSAVLENPAIQRALAITVTVLPVGQKQPEILTGWQFQPEALPEQGYSLSLQAERLIEPGGRLELAALFGWGDTPEATLISGKNMPAFGMLQQTRLYWNSLHKVVNSRVEYFAEANWFIRQNLTYILACCAVPVKENTTCLITDHQLLPLAWTRDSYYQASALLSLYKQIKDTEAVELARHLAKLVRGHLNWLFRIADRPQGYWGRSYLANGYCKDLAYQLDQQCYPYLELVDYLEATGDRALAQELRPELVKGLGQLLGNHSGEIWLFPTSETPADDKVEMPYHLSSQILIWRLLTRLAQVNLLENYSPAQLTTMAERVRSDIYNYLVVKAGDKQLFCYITDLKGNYQLYHDANDWPLVLAPLWNFCDVTDPVWQTTLDFAFSPANKGGYYPGQFGGLGSVHTPHPWPLGDLQELLLAYLQQDKTRLSLVWEKLRKVATWDGCFTEAYSEDTGQVESRHWFGWPGAMLLVLLLSGDFSGEIG